MAKKIVKEKAIEETLWQSCDKLRGSVEPAEYKHVILGLIFLKFASDEFEQRRKELIAEGKERFYVILPGEFVNNSRTTRMGEKVCLGYNNTDVTFLTS